MVIGLLQLSLEIPDSQSLKDKRQVLLSLKTRLKSKFNVSVSEVEDQDKWQAATLAVACVGTDQQFVNRILSSVVDFVEKDREARLLSQRLEFF